MSGKVSEDFLEDFLKEFLMKLLTEKISEWVTAFLVGIRGWNLKGVSERLSGRIPGEKFLGNQCKIFNCKTWWNFSRSHLTYFWKTPNNFLKTSPVDRRISGGIQIWFSNDNLEEISGGIFVRISEAGFRIFLNF